MAFGMDVLNEAQAFVVWTVPFFENTKNEFWNEKRKTTKFEALSVKFCCFSFFKIFQNSFLMFHCFQKKFLIWCIIIFLNLLYAIYLGALGYGRRKRTSVHNHFIGEDDAKSSLEEDFDFDWNSLQKSRKSPPRQRRKISRSSNNSKNTSSRAVSPIFIGQTDLEDEYNSDWSSLQKVERKIPSPRKIPKRKAKSKSRSKSRSRSRSRSRSNSRRRSSNSPVKSNLMPSGGGGKRKNQKLRKRLDWIQYFWEFKNNKLIIKWFILTSLDFLCHLSLVCFGYFKNFQYENWKIAKIIKWSDNMKNKYFKIFVFK